MCRMPLLLLWLTTQSVLAQAPCIEASMLSDPDLPNMPVPVKGYEADCQECAFQCLANAQCQGFNWAQPGCSVLPCPYAGGCCWLKKSASSATTINITSKCASGVGSYVMRAPPSREGEKATPEKKTSRERTRDKVLEKLIPASATPITVITPVNTTTTANATTTKAPYKNVLYFLVDDMRPNVKSYEQDFMYTPNLDALSQKGLTFSRAYCNIAVCSPSRMSFLTGRYPATTQTWNFINHFRQANCEEISTTATPTMYPDHDSIDSSDSNSNSSSVLENEEADVYKTVYITNGGAGQCCSLCTAEQGRCKAWTYRQQLCNPQGGGLGPCGNCSLATSSSIVSASLSASATVLSSRRQLLGREWGNNTRARNNNTNTNLTNHANASRTHHALSDFFTSMLNMFNLSTTIASTTTTATSTTTTATTSSTTTATTGNTTTTNTTTRNYRFRASSTVRGWMRRQTRLDHYSEPTNAVVSGLVGTTTSRKWISLPQHFTQAGYLSLSSGKIFHTEQGGNGPVPWDAPGTGMPPLQDPPSWTPGNFSMANVNAIAPMRPCEHNSCSVPATKEGDVPKGTFRFCDQIISDDAVDKLNYAITNYQKKAQPFFLAVGFRKPHLPFRHPSPWDDYYPNVSDIAIARHTKMDTSVPSIAHHASSIGPNPYEPISDSNAQLLRRDYYAAISWMDYNLGKVMNVLNSYPSVANDTLVVFHADHGYSLGEHGQWEKFTNWEHGTRVPLIVKAPWLSKSVGQTTRSIVELIDVFPSIAELANNPVPSSYGLDGASFAAVVQDPTAQLSKNTSLSVFPRCPSDTSDPTKYWQHNDCDMTERSNFFSMGVTIREDDWRYTEWLPWDGKALRPLFGEKPIGVELYTHTNDTDSTFDGPWEQVNQAGDSQYAPVQARLAALLRERYNQADPEDPEVTPSSQ